MAAATGCYWREDIRHILRAVTAAYLTNAHPRDAAIVARYAAAVAEAFDVQLGLPAALTETPPARLLRGEGR